MGDIGRRGVKTFVKLVRSQVCFHTKSYWMIVIRNVQY